MARSISGSCTFALSTTKTSAPDARSSLCLSSWSFVGDFPRAFASIATKIPQKLKMKSGSDLVFPNGPGTGVM